MKTISIISQKGGAGKTTLAVHLATAAQAAGITSVIVDTDPQATAARWSKWRGGSDPDVVDCAAHSLLADKLAKLEQAGAELAIVDTPPHADIMARTACQCSDLVLIPCRPRAFDLDAIRATAELAIASKKPAFAIFNAGPPRAAVLYAQASKIIQSLGLEIVPVVMAERASYHHSVGEGKTAFESDPKGKAAEDMSKLWKWLSVHVPTRRRAGKKASVA